MTKVPSLEALGSIHKLKLPRLAHPTYPNISRYTLSLLGLQDWFGADQSHRGRLGSLDPR